MLSQNRIFSFTNSKEIKIYPLVFAQAATFLKSKGHDVLYLDGINERLSSDAFLQVLEMYNPDLCVIETKVPVIKAHWDFIDQQKQRHGWIFALIGDHVSFFPEESLEKCKTDYVLTGGDFDVSLSSLADYLTTKDVKELAPGTYFRQDGKIVNNGSFKPFEKLDELPFIDRDLTRWNIYQEAYLRKPCTYILSGRGCMTPKGIGRCGFCIWQYALWRCTARLRSPANVVAEIDEIMLKYKVREIFDDNESGLTSDSAWLEEFCYLINKKRLQKKINISSNARADQLDKKNCIMLRKSGVRLLKIGIESGCNKSLKELMKDEAIEEIIEKIKIAKDNGLNVMVTTMVGYPWESEEDVRQTYNIAKRLMLYKPRCGDSLEANVIIPYPGTPLYKLSIKNSWFIKDPKDYDIYGLSEGVLRCQINPEEWCSRLWSIHLHPCFILRSFITARDLNDFKLLFSGARSLLGHMKDWSGFWSS